MKRINTRNVAKIFILSLIISGITFGIIYYNMQNNSNQSLIVTKVQEISNKISSTHQNVLLKHMLTIIILIFLSYSIIGIPVILFYLFYECSSIGFLIAAFYSTYKFKGAIFLTIFTIISKIPFLLFIIYISYISLKITKKMINVLIFKENDSLYQILRNFMLKLIVIIIAAIIYDLFLFFFANKFLKLFLFLLK